MVTSMEHQQKKVVSVPTSEQRSLDRILALSLRPRRLADMVGQEELSRAISSQFQSGRVPHFFIIDGPVGSGKTTLGRILAMLVQLQPKPFRDLVEEDWVNYKKYDITEINAANKTGVDDMRQLVSSLRFMPLPPSKAKVIILDEAHQLSNAAQNTMITETEDVAAHVFVIFITSAEGKLIPALRSRAFRLSPLPLDEKGVESLVSLAREKTGYNGDVNGLVERLIGAQIVTPRLVLQTVERHFCGLQDAGTDSTKQKMDALAICRSVSTGDWSACSARLASLAKGDVAGLRVAVAGYLKTLLLKSNGVKAVAIGRAIERLSAPLGDEMLLLPAFCAALCAACWELTPPKQKLQANEVKK
jgi:DNA polymerase III delta prime subunit